jgi:hypothetical protein
MFNDFFPVLANYAVAYFFLLWGYKIQEEKDKKLSSKILIIFLKFFCFYAAFNGALDGMGFVLSWQICSLQELWVICFLIMLLCFPYEEFLNSIIDSLLDAIFPHKKEGALK